MIDIIIEMTNFLVLSPGFAVVVVVGGVLIFLALFLNAWARY